MTKIRTGKLIHLLRVIQNQDLNTCSLAPQSAVLPYLILPFLVHHSCHLAMSSPYWFSGSGGREPACQCRRHRVAGSVPGSGRALGEGHDNPLQYSCLENPMDREAWRATVHGTARVRHDLATDRQAGEWYDHLRVFKSSSASCAKNRSEASWSGNREP